MIKRSGLFYFRSFVPADFLDQFLIACNSRFHIPNDIPVRFIDVLVVHLPRDQAGMLFSFGHSPAI